MNLTFTYDPVLNSGSVDALREAVGWDVNPERTGKAAAGAYFRLGCLDGDLLVGYLEVISDAVDDAYIRNLMVHPAYRRRGIALKMLRMAVDRARSCGIQTCNVLFEPELAPFYLKAGFEIIAGGIITNKRHN